MKKLALGIVIGVLGQLVIANISITYSPLADTVTTQVTKYKQARMTGNYPKL